MDIIQNMTPWGLSKMVDILQTAFLISSSWQKIIVFWIKFSWKLISNDLIDNKSALI